MYYLIWKVAIKIEVFNYRFGLENLNGKIPNMSV